MSGYVEFMQTKCACNRTSDSWWGSVPSRPGGRGPPTMSNLGVRMKIVKNLLLGSTAGLVAVSATQAADLPVKAKPVQYVRICDLYGAGFYYIPGSEICLKIGGYVQADYGWNVTGARTQHYSGAAGAQDRTVNPYSTRHRAHFNFDSRTQTSYGTLRTYVAIHIDNENIGTVTVN